MSFEILRSWAIQNSPWKLNLVEYKLRNLSLKSGRFFCSCSVLYTPSLPLKNLEFWIFLQWHIILDYSWQWRQGMRPWLYKNLHQFALHGHQDHEKFHCWESSAFDTFDWKNNVILSLAGFKENCFNLKCFKSSIILLRLKIGKTKTCQLKFSNLEGHKSPKWIPGHFLETLWVECLMPLLAS